MSTKKTYVKVAAIIAGDISTASTPSARLAIRNLGMSLADMFASERSEFNRDRFYSASLIDTVNGTGRIVKAGK